MGKLWRRMRPAVLWSFRRGSWPYDVIVVAILAFIFLTPREFFQDQPRPPAVQEIEELSDGLGTIVFWVDSSVVDSAPRAQAPQRLQRLLKQRTGKNLRVIAHRPAADAEGAVRAYVVYARP